MHSISAKLFGANILGVVVWMENTQNLFGMIGAILSCVSGLIFIALNWEKFLQSKPALAALALWIRFKARIAR